MSKAIKDTSEVKVGDRVFWHNDKLGRGTYWNGVIFPDEKFKKGYKILYIHDTHNVSIEAHNLTYREEDIRKFKLAKIEYLTLLDKEIDDLETMGYR